MNDYLRARLAEGPPKPLSVFEQVEQALRKSLDQIPAIVYGPSEDMWQAVEFDSTPLGESAALRFAEILREAGIDTIARDDDVWVNKGDLVRVADTVRTENAESYRRYMEAR